MTENKTNIIVEQLKEKIEKVAGGTDVDENEIPDMDGMMKTMMEMFSGAGLDEEQLEAMKPVIKFVKDHTEAKLPTYGSKNSSGFDLYTPLAFSIKSGETKVIDSGIKIANLPSGIELQVRPRSGLAAKDSITVLNTPGTIDNDYRNNLKVILINLGKETKLFKKHDRICQCVPMQVQQYKLDWAEENEITETERGEGGLGSTGA